MKIYSDTIDLSAARLALKDAQISGVSLDFRKQTPSRKKTITLDVSLDACPCEDHTRKKNTGQHGANTWDYEHAATWMEWGWWIACMFRHEPGAIIGQYDGIDDFHIQTAAVAQHRAKRDLKVRGFLKRWNIQPGQSPFVDVDFHCPPRELVNLQRPTVVNAWLDAS